MKRLFFVLALVLCFAPATYGAEQTFETFRLLILSEDVQALTEFIPAEGITVPFKGGDHWNRGKVLIDLRNKNASPDSVYSLLFQTEKVTRLKATCNVKTMMQAASPAMGFAFSNRPYQVEGKNLYQWDLICGTKVLSLYFRKDKEKVMLLGADFYGMK